MKLIALKKLLVLGLMTVLTACQTDMTATPPTEPLVCTQWLPLTYASRHDSKETSDAVRRANARRNAYCE